MKKKIIIFDLDGVLINSIKNMRFALNRTSKKMGIQLNFKEYIKYLGLPFEEIMKKMKINKNVIKIKKNYEKFSEKNLDKIIIKKNIINELKHLKKSHELSVFTSKNRRRTLKILKKYKLFKCIISADDVKKGKPNPEGLKKIISYFKTNKKNCVYVGDSLYDYRASNSINIKYLHASWGYDKKLFKRRNFKKINKIRDISKILNS